MIPQLGLVLKAKHLLEKVEPTPEIEEWLADAERALTTETLYRCSRCGQWSHARRKPGWHKRFVREHRPTDTVILRIEPIYDHMNGFTDDGGYLIRCGPFDTYRARRSA